MGVCAWVFDGVAELVVDEPGAVGVAVGEVVADDFEAGREEQCEGGEDSGCTLVEPACGIGLKWIECE